MSKETKATTLRDVPKMTISPKKGGTKTLPQPKGSNDKTEVSDNAKAS